MEKRKKRKYPKISDAFKGLRAELDTWEKECTQNELTSLIKKKTGISIKKPQISELENGNREPSIRELKAYSIYFNTPMEYLLGLKPNRHYENILVNKNLGLSDDVINSLKIWIEKNPSCNIIFVLNHIFKIGYGYAFLNALSHYFYGIYDEFMMSKIYTKEEKVHMRMLQDCSVYAVNGDDMKTAVIKNTDIEYIFQQKLYNVLSEIRKEIRKQGLECETDFYDGFNLPMNHNDFEDFKSESEMANDAELIKHLKKIRGENG